MVIFTSLFCIFCNRGKKRKIIISDLHAIENQINIKLPLFFQLLYQLHTNRYFRDVFYYRIGPTLDLLISCIALAISIFGFHSQQKWV